MRKKILSTFLSFILFFSIFSVDSYAQTSITNGTLNNLVLFIQFSDEKNFQITNDITYYNDIFNGSSTGGDRYDSDYGKDISLRAFYKEISYNKLAVNSHFPNNSKNNSGINAYTSLKSIKYFRPYDSSKNTIGYKNEEEKNIRKNELIKEALLYYKPYIEALKVNTDNNSDSYIDSMTFVLSGVRAMNLDMIDHGYFIDYHEDDFLITGVVDTNIDNVTIGNKKINRLLFINGGSIRSGDVGYSEFSYSNTTTLRKTFFNLLGAKDLYINSFNGGYQYDTPVGSYDILSNGGYHPTMYSKEIYGNWVSDIPIISSSYKGYTLNPVTSLTNNAVKIKSPNSDTEYIMLEYRKNYGNFETLSNNGLLVYRVNTNNTNKGNVGAVKHSDLEVYAYRVDGSFTNDLGNGSNYGNLNKFLLSDKLGRTSMGKTTNPTLFLSDGSFFGITLSNVKELEGSIVFDITIEENTKPIVKDLKLTSSNLLIQQEIIASYTYFDEFEDLEGDSIYEWYRADSETGLNEELITGENKLTYTPTKEDKDKYLIFKVTPRANKEPIVGDTYSVSTLKKIEYNPSILPNITLNSIIAIENVPLSYQYSFIDENGFKEENSIVQWSVSGSAINVDYIPTNKDVGASVHLSVTPRNEIGLIGITKTLDSTISSSKDLKPFALNLAFNTSPSAFTVDTDIKASYDFFDYNKNTEQGSIYKWYRADDNLGSNKTLITGANNTTYRTTSHDLDKYLIFEVTPKINVSPFTGDTSYIISSVPVGYNPQIKPTIKLNSITAIVGSPLSYTFVYNDLNGSQQSNSIINWIVNGVNKGSSYTPITGDINKTVVLEVTPKNTLGITGDKVSLSATIKSNSSGNNNSNNNNDSDNDNSSKTTNDKTKEELPIIKDTIKSDSIVKRTKYINGYPDNTFRPNNKVTRAEACQILFSILSNVDDVTLHNKFSDIKSSDWSYKAIAYLNEIGVISGYPNNTFNPNSSITRAEFVVMVDRLLKLSDTTTNSFIDVDNTHWASNSINRVLSKGYISGYGDGTFKPNNEITRAEMVSLVNRVLGIDVEKEDISNIKNTFTDLDKTHWAYKHIIVATKE